jgi:protein TonB
MLLVVGFNCYAVPDSTKVEIISAPNANFYYPSFSKRAGEQGSAVCRIYFNESGIVEEAVIVSSSGYWRLDRAANEMCKQYKIKPFIIKDTPVKLRTDLNINFSLKD